MIVHECDRCGRRIGENDITLFALRQKGYLPDRDTMIPPVYQVMGAPAHVDELCQKCSDDLSKWMKAGKQK